MLCACNAFIAVSLGAFGAHVLKPQLTADNLEIFKTGAQYQMVHALGIGILAAIPESKYALACVRLFQIGIILFSFSLYTLSLTGVRWLGAITPLGGFCFLSSWAILAVMTYKSK